VVLQVWLWSRKNNPTFFNFISKFPIWISPIEK
jgi:hypothetical protein